MSTLDARAWLDAANTLMFRAVAELDDVGFVLPSTLPNWTNAHIVAHLHYNAEAIGRLVVWARTGVETPMYVNMEQRDDDVESGALLAPDELRSMLSASTRKLMDSFDALTPAMWEHKVVTAQGRTVPASEVVWMRFREVGVHTIDLGTGLTYADLPVDAVSKLVGEIVAKRLGAGEGPALAAILTGRILAGPPLGPWL
jgi:maleylpyruvate isomerase